MPIYLGPSYGNTDELLINSPYLTALTKPKQIRRN